jgi:hypothetical protein
MTQLTRRDFLRLCGTSSIGLALAACGVTPTPTVTPAPTNTALPTSTALLTATTTLTSTPAPTSTATPTRTPTATPRPLTIGDLASALGIGFSTQVDPYRLRYPDYENAISYFNGVMFSEAYMKGWTTTANGRFTVFRPAPNQYEWAYFDAITKLTKEKGLPIQLLLHLVGGAPQYLPDWVQAITDPTQLEKVIEDHIRTVCEYMGRFALPRQPNSDKPKPNRACL